MIAYKQSHQYQGSNPEDLQVFAKKLGIDTTGKTNEQVKSAIKEKGSVSKSKTYSREDLAITAKAMGIDGAGLSDEQLINAIKQAKQNLNQ
jgi:hypothetical protein